MTAPQRADVVVIGAGLAGSAAAWALAGRGRDVVVLEAFRPGHRHGSSYGSARIFRRAYPDPLYVRLTGAAGALWRDLEAEAGEELVHVTGALDFGPAGQQEQMYELLTHAKVAAELLPAQAASRRWPGFAFGGHPVMFHPEGGVIDAERAMAAMRRLAAGHGAVFRYDQPVTSVDADDSGCLVRTAELAFRARVVVVAAGAWLPDLLAGQVRLPPLAVTQQQAFNFAPRYPGAPDASHPDASHPDASHPDASHPQASDGEPAAQDWPAFICYAEPTFYGLPAGRDGEVPGAIKVGHHNLGKATTADTRDNVVDPAFRAIVTRFVAETMPGLHDQPIGELTCLYTSTENDDFILDRHGPFVICSACSGHGAKFAPLVGSIAADLADGGTVTVDRFALAAHLGREQR